MIFPMPTVPQPAKLSVTDLPQGCIIGLGGCWTAAGLVQDGVWQDMNHALKQQHRAVEWNLTELDQLDHLGAQVLWNHWGKSWPGVVKLKPEHRAVLDRVDRFTTRPPASIRDSFSHWLQRYGARVWSGFAQVADFVRLVGQLVLDLIQLLSSPRWGPWRDVSGHLYQFGATALPITALVGFLIGVVFAYLTSQQLRLFGADAFIVDILGLSLIRELGPILAAILMAGRSGSAITAQVGVMRVTEELDAMRVMGIPLGYRLVMPRALALALVMPLISVWTTLAALAGGMLSAELVLQVSPAFFFEALPKAVSVPNLYLALGKSLVFGLLIALTGCHFGLRVQPNTESLGQGTTASVVTAITMVIVVDAIFAVVFKDVGL